MDLDAPQMLAPPDAAADAAAAAFAVLSVKRANTAAIKLPAVALEDLDEEAAAALLVQPLENPLQVAARCMSKLPAVIRLVLSRSNGSDVNFFLAAQAVSRIVGCYHHILPLLLRYFRSSKSLLSLLENAPSVPSNEATEGQFCVLNILKTALRLYEVAPDYMLHMWEWTPVARVLASQVEQERALGVQVLSMILHLTEKESIQLASGLHQVNLSAGAMGQGQGGGGDVDGDEEEKEVQLATLFAHDVAVERAPAALQAWRASHESSSTGVDLGGVLLERELDGGDDATELSHGSHEGGGGRKDKFVLTNTVNGNLARFGAALCRDAPILVEGPSASGKTAMVSVPRVVLRVLYHLQSNNIYIYIHKQIYICIYICIYTCVCTCVCIVPRVGYHFLVSQIVQRPTSCT